ncbi:glycoside hydrolase family 88 protein [Yeosuana marina]|uniref:glycoside hydrolase family 88 protein n=1 Tax=Yeosuana marina TaxID=1565536 RepID=UPI00141E52B5|nr:glycoside hydrolase family 88 protein [Yeosuana marina]
MIKFSHFIIGFMLLLCACKPNNKENRTDTKSVSSILDKRYSDILEYPLDSMAFPRSMDIKTGDINGVPSKDWTSGFFPGNLWQLYKITGNEAYKIKAEQWTAFSEKEKLNKASHDAGFKVYCSVGNAFEITDNQHYKDVIIEAAKTLISRYNPNVGAIKSWDFNSDEWQYPVIIDNMMNLELLFKATQLSQDSIYYNIAVQHANTTLKNHFRKDNSSYHVIVYDTISGKPYKKITHQGYSDESAWARGQSWAVYGYTMAYRFTKNSSYLDQAKATALYFINNKNLPEDGIPYWDFNDPSIPNVPKDVSAATIMASALIELYSYTRDDQFLNYSKKVIESLKSREYIIPEKVKAPFIFMHSTGNLPANSEIDEPIVYADYYYLESVLRMLNSQK